MWAWLSSCSVPAQVGEADKQSRSSPRQVHIKWLLEIVLLLASSSPSPSHCCWVFYVHLRKQCSAKVYNYALIVVAKWKDEARQYDEKIMLNFVVCFDQKCAHNFWEL